MRSRNLKPGLFKNPELADAGPIAQLLFAGLWLLADKEGRLKDQPRLIKAEIFPYYEVDVNGELTVIERLGHIHRYKVDGIRVIEVCNFKKHQSPHHTEKASELPACNCGAPCETLGKHGVRENHGEVTVDSPLEHGESRVSLMIPSSLIPDSLIPDSLLGRGGTSRAARTPHRGTRLPDDFTLTTEREAYARAKGVEPEPAFEAFVAYWQSKPKDNTKLDWDKTWHSWVLRDAKDSSRRLKPKATRFAELTARSSAGAHKDQGFG